MSAQEDITDDEFQFYKQELQKFTGDDRRIKKGLRTAASKRKYQRKSLI